MALTPLAVDQAALNRRLGGDGTPPLELSSELAVRLHADAAELLPPLVGVRAAFSGLRVPGAGLRATYAVTSRAAGGTLVEKIDPQAMAFNLNNDYPTYAAATTYTASERGIGTSRAVCTSSNQAAPYISLTGGYAINSGRIIEINHYIPPGGTLYIQCTSTAAVTYPTIYFREFEARPHA